MSKKLTTRIWILIIVLALSFLAMFGLPPSFLEKGVLITSIEQNSTAFEQGLKQGQVIKSINGNAIENIDDYYDFVQSNFPFDSEEKIIIKTKESEAILFIKNAPPILVSEIPATKIKTGLDLAGGARALVKAKNKELSSKEVNNLVEITSNRFNVYGISDIKISPVSDLSGNHFMLIEIAGATPDDLQKLVEQQGEFEAKIGNKTVFIGGEKDIASVSNDARTSRISCPSGSNYCNFQFAITLSPAAAERHAKITNNLETNESNPEYLEKPLDLYVDQKLVSSLQISQSLKGRVTTQISISGSERGENTEEAYASAQEEMKRLKTVLKTGSLPYKLEVVKLDTISPTLGKNFVRIIIIAGIVALIAASIIVFIRYKNIKSSLALVVASLSEIVIILGIASMIDWNLDLASIAGVLATVGTGFDDMIIILDESKNKFTLSLKQKLKRAFTIIMGAYFTAVVSLLPLLWAGAGLLKGFAITTIIGISVGVFITRPAFSDFIKKIEK